LVERHFIAGDTMAVTKTLVAAAVLLILVGAWASGETYKVGPGERYATVTQVADELQPGDVVEITGDITDPFTLTKHGTWEEPITVRGITRVENGRVIRPKVIITGKESLNVFGVTCKGDWNVLEGLDIGYSQGASAVRGAVTQMSNNLTLRNCYLHHNNQALGITSEAGETVVELCEFDSNGGGRSGVGYSSGNCIYSWTGRPGAVLTVRGCYFHNATGSSFIKSRAPRNVICYNWFETSYYSMLKIIDNMSGRSYGGGTEDLHPMHTDILGNVFHQGWGPGPRYDLMQLGAEGEESCGTEGDFHIAHNLFIMTRRPSTTIRINGNVDRVRMWNNVFVALGSGEFTLYERGPTWDTARTRDFQKRRGTSEPTLEGANNWASETAKGIPEVFQNALKGLNPKFADLVNYDCHPAADSPLAGAGLTPLPKGRIIDLVPEFEPQRGIPLSGKMVPRRQAAAPSIGPFETAR
jgi:hypothetical protein